MHTILKKVVILSLAPLLFSVVLALAGEPGDDAAIRKGKRIYLQYCIPCHGQKGNGKGDRAIHEKLDPAPRDHTDGRYMNRLPDMRLFMVIKFGGKAMNLSQIMPQWGHILSDKEIVQVIRYVRTLADPPWQPGMAMCGCRLPGGPGQGKTDQGRQQ